MLIMSNHADLDVLFSGYSYHKKAFSFKSEHLKFNLFRLQTEGCSMMRVNGKLEKIEPGDLLIFGRNEPYELVINGECVPENGGEIASGDYYLFARGAWMEDWWNQQERPHKLKIQLNDGLITLFRHIAKEQQKRVHQTDEILRHYAKIICLTIDRMLIEQPDRGKGFIAWYIKRYIEQNFATPFKLEDIAADAGISCSRAVHLFKENYGKSIMQYALEIRLHMARERLVYSPAPLHVIAETSGFSSYTYFFRVFKEYFGISPKQYRAHHSEY